MVLNCVLCLGNSEEREGAPPLETNQTVTSWVTRWQLGVFSRVLAAAFAGADLTMSGPLHVITCCCWCLLQVFEAWLHPER